MILTSKRLSLMALSLNDLQVLGDGGVLETDIDFKDFDLSKDQVRAISIKVDKMTGVDTTRHQWLTYWLIIQDKQAIGLIGFKGLNEDKHAEVGYGLTKSFEGRGYMSEALGLILKWARDKGAVAITASKVLTDNRASQIVLEKNGFECLGLASGTYDYIRWL